jgi:hypothetical protein
MTNLEWREPQGWRELRAKLQAENDPKQFQRLLNEINLVLSINEVDYPEKGARPRRTVTEGTKSCS